jgi:DHA1 family multidrug resistance protein-like MFS transporter
MFKDFTLPSKSMAVLLLLVFCKQIGNGMVWSIIAAYGHSLGASAAVVGLMVSSYGGARLLVNFPAGYASERFGRRRMMSAGCVVLAIASFTAVMTSQIGPLFGCLLMMGLASSAFMTSALAAVADLGTPGKRVNDMSLYQGANMIGAAMGPALGGLTAGLAGYNAPFLVNGCIATVGIIAFAVMPWSEPKDKIEARKTPATRAEMVGFVRKGGAIWLMVFSLFFVRSSANWILMPIIAQERFGLELATIGLILTMSAVANVCTLPFTAGLAARFGRIRMILLAGMLTLTAVALMAFGFQPTFFWVSSMLFGLGAGVGTPMLTSFVADMAPADLRGPAMGLLRTMQDLALFVGPFFVGLLSDNLGYGFQGGLFGCLTLIGLATLTFWLRAGAGLDQRPGVSAGV